MPLVSVVMPVFNGEKFLVEAIESILSQTFTDFELIIVDDGSTDGSADIVRAYAERDSRIRFIQLSENTGEASARNASISVACGDYIAAMDCDIISLPERLQRQVEFMESHPEIGGVGVGCHAVSEDLTPMFTYRLPDCHCLIVLSMFVSGQAMIYASVMARRKLLMSAGGYDPQMGISSDTELFTRMVGHQQIKLANLSAPLYVYRRHQDAISLNLNNVQFQGALVARRQMLARLWNETPDATLDRFYRMRVGKNLNWAERRAAKRDMIRVIESMIDAKWVEPADKQLLLDEMKRRLESSTPRIWQMFLHWWRYRIGRFLK